MLKNTTFLKIPWTQLIIFSLSTVCFANTFCMETNNTVHLQQINPENKCWLLLLPKEIIKEIIKLCFECSNEEELKQILLRLPQVNTFFRQLLYKDEQILVCAFKSFQEIKKAFYLEKTNLKYDPNYQNPIMITLRANLLSQIKDFANNKENNAIEAKNETNKNEILINAARHGNLDLIVLSLCNGADDINAKNLFDRTALIYATEYGHKYIVELLLAKGADIEFKDRYDSTALLVAAYMGHKDIVELLLAKGANIEAKDKLGGRALSVAASRGHQEIVGLLMDKGADVEAKDYNGNTALMWAASMGHKEVKQLLENPQKK